MNIIDKNEFEKEFKTNQNLKKYLILKYVISHTHFSEKLKISANLRKPLHCKIHLNNN